jgi:hypothetical protein
LYLDEEKGGTMRKGISSLNSTRLRAVGGALVLLACGGAANAAAPKIQIAAPQFTTAAAFDVSRPVRDIAPPKALTTKAFTGDYEPSEVRPERELDLVGADTGFSGDGAIQESGAGLAQAISSPNLTFEGLRNTDNPGLLSPPDPVGDVGPNHYVEMVNNVFAIYDKQGHRLAGPTQLAKIWEGFPVLDCFANAGDPVVLYDQLEDRWILTQFTTAGNAIPNGMFYNCVAISQTGDPTGAYYRYAFPSGRFFPDYPKYGVWSHSYLLTSRDFGPTVEYGISVYALEKNKMLAGNPDARAVKFFLDSDVVPLSEIGDGLLPADVDGTRRPQAHVPALIVGTQDNDSGYGATVDALNVYELDVQWKARPTASLTLTQLPVAPFDSIFPCAPASARDCLPQPGVTDSRRFLDILSYRQRPTHRLAYRNFGTYEAVVTNQSVEARPGVAGVRWYEIRRTDGVLSVNQQGTYAPNDGVHRWMGSVAMDWQGNMALGYSVTNATDVFPGIRYTGRLNGDTPGVMTLGEGVIINGTGAQLSLNSRWGDYTSMNVDPTNDCTFWYVNEYIQTTGTAFWQTRIGSFTLPGCVPRRD